MCVNIIASLSLTFTFISFYDLPQHTSVAHPIHLQCTPGPGNHVLVYWCRKKAIEALEVKHLIFPHISLLGFFECSQASRDGTGGKQSPFLKFRKNVIAFTSLKKPPSREFVAFNSNLSNLLEVVPVAFPFLEKFVSSRKMNRKKLMERHFSKIIEFGIGKKDLLYMLVAELCRRILHYI